MNFIYFISELSKLLRDEKELVKKIVLFAAVLGIFELTIPFSVQVIINRIYKTYMYDPLVAIMSVAMICLVIFSVLLFIRFNLVETIQRILVVKISNNIIPYFDAKNDVYNSLKFFEIITLKKFLAKFLTDGISLFLSLILGFFILIFYHPFFASLAFVIVFSFIFLIVVYHNKTAQSSIDESKSKYDIAKILNTYAHDNNIDQEKLLSNATQSYLNKRDVHFKLLKKHYLVILILFIISHIILLGIGGVLVLSGELTIGQLVASELIFSTILLGIAKSIDYIEIYFDSFASLEKLSFIKSYKKSSQNIKMDEYNTIYRAIKLITFTLPLLLLFLPWVQTSEGIGTLTTLRPDERVQEISAFVSGRIGKWYVSEGDFIQKGSPIVEIVDNDPDYSKRLKVDKDAAFKKYQAAKMAAETAYLDFQRQKQLYEQGLSSRLSFEKAQINYHKLIASEAEAASSLAKKEVNYARQQRQVITAPTDGTVQQLYSGHTSSLIKEGTKLAVFVPTATTPAVEIFVDGNDVPLIQVGRDVRVEFEGFPAFQFSGWPSFAFGTFAGKVVSVDSTSYGNGKFRVMVAPKDASQWPGDKILRRGAKVKGWILMNTVSLGYELWRQFNGFPPLPDEIALKKTKANGK